MVKKCRSKNDNFGFLLKKFRIKQCWILGFPKRPKDSVVFMHLHIILGSQILEKCGYIDI